MPGARRLAGLAGLACLASLAFLASPAGCGAPARPPAHGPDAASEDGLARWLPRGPALSLRDSALAVLPADGVLGGVAARSLRHLHAVLGVSALDGQVRAALGAAITERARVDLVDLDAAARAGVDLDRSLAVALLADNAAAIVLPVADPDQFVAAVEAADAGERTVYTEIARAPGHAVILLAADGDGDYDLDRWRRAIERTDPARSLAASPAFAAAAADLAFGPDAIGYVDAAQLARAIRAALDADAADEPLSRDEIADSLRDARAAGDVERMTELEDALMSHLERDIAADLAAELLGPVSAIAFGIGAARDRELYARVVVRASDTAARPPSAGTAGDWTRAALAAPALTDLYAHGARAGAGAQAAVTGRAARALTRWWLGPAAALRLDAIAGAIGLDVDRGVVPALTGQIEWIADAGPGGVAERIALPVRRAGGLRERLARLARVPSVRFELLRAGAHADAGAGYRHGPWRVSLAGDRIVLERGPLARARAAGAPLPAVIRRMATARGAGARLVVGRGALRAVLASGADTGGAGGMDDGWLRPPPGDDDADDEPVTAYTALEGQRDRLVRERDAVAARRRAAALDLLGDTAAIARRADGRVVATAVHVLAGESLARLARRAAIAWFEAGERSPRGQAIARLDAELARQGRDLRAEQSRRRMERWLRMRAARPAQARGGGGAGAGSPRAPGRAGRPRRPGIGPPGQARDPARARAVTSAASASVIAVSGRVDRAAAARALADATPRLRACHDAHRARHADAQGFVTATLHLASAGRPEPAVELAVDRDAIGLAVAPFTDCVREALLARLAGVAGDGRATATLWFGMSE